MANVLISCIGRRSDLVLSFKRELIDKGIVIATDANMSARGLEAADKSFNVPTSDSRDYIPKLLEICSTESVKFIVSLNVSDLLVLIKNKEKFLEIGCSIIGGKESSIIQTYDKLFLHRMCVLHNLPTIPTFSLGNIASSDVENMLPLLIKPRYGSGSRGILKINTIGDLVQTQQDLLRLNEEFIVQKFVSGQEYGLDVINDFNGAFAAVNVRKKLAMKNGETYEAITCTPNAWKNLAQNISKMVRHEGIIDLDLIQDGKSNYIIDINYRFGGGYAFTAAAGVNIPRAYVAWMYNQIANPKCFFYETHVIGQRQVDDTISIQYL